MTWSKHRVGISVTSTLVLLVVIAVACGLPLRQHELTVRNVEALLGPSNRKLVNPRFSDAELQKAGLRRSEVVNTVTGRAELWKSGTVYRFELIAISTKRVEMEKRIDRGQTTVWWNDAAGYAWLLLP